MDIPGLQIERELSHFGHTWVYLASQLNPYRRVAVKVARCGDGMDPAARLRELLAQGALRPELQHQRIVHVQKAGAQGPFLYLVMEHLEGGNLEQNLAWGLGLGKLLGAVCGLCDALDHAHGQGLVHGRIRPSNILFRSEAEVVLADFCPLGQIADGAAADARQRGFMSPEHEAGAPLQPASDLFGLGAVLYNALTGEVVRGPGVHFGPHGDLLAFAAKLPVHLKPLQPVLDKALAIDPERRFQSAAAFKNVVEQVRRNAALDDFTVKTAAVSEQEIQRLEKEAPVFVQRDAAKPELRRGRAASRWRRWMAAAFLFLALTGAAAYLVQQQRHWLPALLAAFGLAEDPALQSAWLEARALHEAPDQQLLAIVGAYRRVLALAPGSAAAQEALAVLAEQWRQDVLAALQRGDLGVATVKLRELESALPDDERLDELERQLVNRRAADTLLATTQALLRSEGRSQIPAATVAIQTYQEVLRLAPGHPGALTELASLAEHYAGLAGQALKRGAVEDAIVYLERATTANDQLPILAVVRQQIQQATTSLMAIDELLQQAGAYRAQGFLVHPPGRNAAQLYNQVLATAPDNGIALQGLNEVMARVLNDAARLFEGGDLAGVEALLDQASAAGISDAALNEIKANLERQVQALAAVSEKLEQAQALLQQGFITEPPGANAVSALREIQRLDPDNAAADVLLKEAASRLAAVAVEAFDAGLGDEARLYLDLALTVTPDQAEWRALRQSWR